MIKWFEDYTMGQERERPPQEEGDASEPLISDNNEFQHGTWVNDSTTEDQLQLIDAMDPDNMIDKLLLS